MHVSGVFPTFRQLSPRYVYPGHTGLCKNNFPLCKSGAAEKKIIKKKNLSISV